MNITELLTAQQIRHATSLTHHANYVDEDDIDDPTFADKISDEWIEKRNEFLSHHPLARKMFSENGDTKEYTIRYKNIKFLEDAPSPNSLVWKAITANSNVTIDLDSYRNGKLKYKGKDVSIGSYISKSKLGKEIEDAYSTDIYRDRLASGLYDLVFTGHPIDIYGMSTGREWTSCADMTRKMKYYIVHSDAAGTMGEEIQNHTHMMYILPAGGNIDTDPVGRRSYKLATNGDKSTLIPQTTSMVPYCSAIFRKKFDFLSDSLVRKLFAIESGLWELIDSVYAEYNKPKSILVK